jgi:hypothetical protein
MALWAVLAGCAVHAPPAVFTLPVPAVEAPAGPTLEAAPTDAGAVVSLLAGETAPGDGVLLPPVVLADLRWRAEGLGPYWRTVAETCRDGRVMDRAIAEAEATRRWQYGDELRGELRVVRAAGSAAFIGGVLLGALAVGMVP